jgi:hypothetical protein
MNSSVYATYMPGYTGHIPKIQREEVVNRIKHKKHIPGYSGYIESVKSENVFGKSYGNLTADSLSKNIPKGAEVPPHSRYTSTLKDTFKRSVKIQSTAELLGVSNRKDTYKKPIPIDTINKFWGIDSKKLNTDEVVQTQSFEQSYKNFWSFVDHNELNYKEKPAEDFKTSNNSFWGVNKDPQEIHPGKNFG